VRNGARNARRAMPSLRAEGEAIQNGPVDLDCFVASRLAMTANYARRSESKSGTALPRVPCIGSVQDVMMR
jgi:hypothetical protein